MASCLTKLFWVATSNLHMLQQVGATTTEMAELIDELETIARRSTSPIIRERCRREIAMHQAHLLKRSLVSLPPYVFRTEPCAS